MKREDLQKIIEHVQYMQNMLAMGQDLFQYDYDRLESLCGFTSTKDAELEIAKLENRDLISAFLKVKSLDEIAELLKK